jgi:hypothetical protein
LAKAFLASAKFSMVFTIMIPSVVFMLPYLWSVVMEGHYCESKQHSNWIDAMACTFVEDKEAASYVHYGLFQGALIEQFMSLNWMLGNIVSHGILNADFFSLKTSRRVVWVSQTSADCEIWQDSKIPGKIMYFCCHFLVIVLWLLQFIFLAISAAAPNDFHFVYFNYLQISMYLLAIILLVVQALVTFFRSGDVQWRLIVKSDELPDGVPDLYQKAHFASGH